MIGEPVPARSQGFRQGLSIFVGAGPARERVGCEPEPRESGPSVVEGWGILAAVIFGAAVLPMTGLEYTGIMEKLRTLDGQFTVREISA